MDKDELKMKLESGSFDSMWEINSDILLKISGKLYKFEKFEKLFSPYILCRTISMNEKLFEYAEYLDRINSNSKLSKKQFYKLAYALIPKQRSSYVAYLKKPERKHEEDKDNIIEPEIKNNLFDI